MREPGREPIGPGSADTRSPDPGTGGGGVWSAMPATGIRIIWYSRFATESESRAAYRSNHRFATAGALVMLLGAAAQVVRLDGLEHPAVTHRLWYQLCLWVGLGLLVAAAAAVAAVLAVDRRRNPPVTPLSPRPGDLWVSRPGSYLGPFGYRDGWRNCDEMRRSGPAPAPAAGPAPVPGADAASPAGDPEVPAWLKVTERGIEIWAGERGPAIFSSWAGLRSVSVHFSFTGGEPSWVGLTTIDNRYARFRGERFADLSGVLQRLGASITYEKEPAVRVE